jgi:membrane dipeptidase
MNSKRVPIVDGHLDLAFNVLFDQRDLEHKSPQEIRELEAGMPDKDLCMATLSEMHKGGIAVAFGTLFAAPYISWTHPETPNEVVTKPQKMPRRKAWRNLRSTKAGTPEGRFD